MRHRWKGLFYFSSIFSALLLMGCQPQPKPYYVPPGEVTVVQSVPGDATTVMMTRQPVPGQICWREQHKWYCRPAPSPKK